jgi:hypothetical protein
MTMVVWLKVESALINSPFGESESESESANTQVMV